MSKKEKKDFNSIELEILEGCEAILAHIQGKADFPTQYYSIPEKVNVKKIRFNLHLTQQQFANLIGASVHAIRHWESGRRKPDGPTLTLLYVLQHNPKAILDAFSKLPA